MHRSYADGIIVKNIGQNIELSADESKHVSKVLRIKDGEKIELCDVSGKAYLAEVVTSIGTVEVKVLEEIDNNEPAKEVVLFQSLSKGTKMDLVIQKAVELGVSRIYPVETEFLSLKLRTKALRLSDGTELLWRQ